MELKPLDLDIFERKLRNGLRLKKPVTPLAHALSKKKTLRFGNKADPFQPAEKIHRVSREALHILHELKWSTVIQTRFTETLMEYKPLLVDARDTFIIMPVVSPGAERDWEVLERGRTTPIPERLLHAHILKNKGLSVGINGEPFIPGFHTVEEFEDTLKRIKAAGIKRYNTYNFHFNAFVAKRLHAIGVDIKQIWYYNQDEEWKPILRRLLDVAHKHEMVLGCPDFVNAGINYRQGCNTCCGLDVPNPTTFNTHTWIQMLQDGKDPETILQDSWDGIGDQKLGQSVFNGASAKFYTLKDAKEDSKGDHLF